MFTSHGSVMAPPSSAIPMSNVDSLTLPLPATTPEVFVATSVSRNGIFNVVPVFQFLNFILSLGLFIAFRTLLWP